MSTVLIEMALKIAGMNDSERAEFDTLVRHFSDFKERYDAHYQICSPVIKNGDEMGNQDNLMYQLQLYMRSVGSMQDATIMYVQAAHMFDMDDGPHSMGNYAYTIGLQKSHPLTNSAHYTAHVNIPLDNIEPTSISQIVGHLETTTEFYLNIPEISQLFSIGRQLEPLEIQLLAKKIYDIGENFQTEVEQYLYALFTKTNNGSIGAILHALHNYAK